MTNTCNKTEKWIYLLIAAAIIWLPMILLKLAYNQPDDYMMNYMSNGSYPGEMAALVYPNIIYGQILKFLYGIFPAINWFCVLFLLIITASVFVLFSITESRLARMVVLSIGLILPFFVTFTVVSYLAIGSGTAAIVYGSYKEIHEKKHYIAPVILMLFGFMIRTSTFLSALAVFLPFIILMLLKVKASRTDWIYGIAGAGLLLGGLYISVSIKWNSIPVYGWAILLLVIALGYIISRKSGLYKELFAAFTVIAVGIIILKAANGIYELNNGWDEFKTYTSARAGVLDKPMAEYSSVGGSLSRLGVSEPAFNILKKWIFVDKGVFSTDVLKGMKDVFSATHTGVSVRSVIMNRETMLCIVLPFAAAVITGLKTENKKRLLIGAVLLIIEGLFMILILRQRFVFRVAVPLLMLSIIVMLMLDEKHNSGKIIEIITAALCVAVIGSFYAGGIKARINYDEREKQSLQSSTYLTENTDNCYIIQSFVYNELFYTGKAAFSIGKDEKLANCIKSGSGDSFSPRFYAQLDSLQVKDPDRLLLSLANDERFRFVGRDAEDIQAYLEEQTGEDIDVETEQELNGGIKVYRFVK